MALGKLNRLDLLADLYGQIQIPRAVYIEVVTQGLIYGASDALIIRLFWQQQGWPIVEVLPPILTVYKPSVILGAGEIEVLALAQTIPGPLVLLDDEVARAEARRLKLQVRGTLGVLIQAYQHRISPVWRSTVVYFAHCKTIIKFIIYLDIANTIGARFVPIQD
jgi:predicted nucleic acid-binding protein